MLHNWLTEEENKSHSHKFFVIEIIEKDNFTDAVKLRKFIAEQILNHLDYPDRIKRIFSNQPIENLENHILNVLIPPKNAPFHPQISFWGEILVAVYLEKIKALILPVLKLRYRELYNRAMAGKADVLCCDVSTNNPIIFFSEVKTKTSYDKSKDISIAKKAFDGISSNNVPNPEIVDYISKRLEEKDEYDLMDLFDKFIIDPDSYSKNFQIFLVFDKNQWDEDILEYVDNNVNVNLPNLTINVVLIDSLRDLIDESYSIVLEVAKEVVYE